MATQTMSNNNSGTDSDRQNLNAILGVDTTSEQIRELEQEIGLSFTDLEINDEGEIDGEGKSLDELQPIAHLVSRAYINYQGRNRLWFRTKWLPISTDNSALGRALKRLVKTGDLVSYGATGNTARYCFPEDLPEDSPQVQGVEQSQ